MNLPQSETLIANVISHSRIRKKRKDHVLLFGHGNEYNCSDNVQLQ